MGVLGRHRESVERGQHEKAMPGRNAGMGLQRWVTKYAISLQRGTQEHAKSNNPPDEPRRIERYMQQAATTASADNPLST